MTASRPGDLPLTGAFEVTGASRPLKSSERSSFSATEVESVASAVV